METIVIVAAVACGFAVGVIVGIALTFALLSWIADRGDHGE